MAASLANHFILERAEVELITTGGHNVASGSGQEHLYKILASLATLQPAEPPDGSGQLEEGTRRRRWRLRRRPAPKSSDASSDPASELRKPNGDIAWRLLDEVPVLRDERRFKVLITSARKGTIPGHVWRSAHVVFMEDL
jgi:uncharacterized protein (DUF58 family)